MLNSYKTIFYFLFLHLAVTLQGQQRIYEGHEFIGVLTEERVAWSDKLFITSSFNTCVQVSVPLRNFQQMYTINANQITVIHVDSLYNFFRPDSAVMDTIFDKSYFIRSALPIAVVKNNVADKYIQGEMQKPILPNSQLSNIYLPLHGRYNHYSGIHSPTKILITSGSDSNEIYIKPHHKLLYHFGFPSGPPHFIIDQNGGTILLNKGESIIYETRYPYDMLYGLNMSWIKSDRPISILVRDYGNMNAFDSIHYACASQNNFVFTPNYTYYFKPLTLAKTYYPISPVNQSSKDYVHLLATQPNTTIYYNGQPVAQIDSLQLWDTCFADAAVVSANKPIMMGQFVQRTSSYLAPHEAYGIGVQSSDTSEFISKAIFYAFHNPDFDSTAFRLNIITYTSNRYNLLLNNAPVLASWQAFPANPELSWCRIQVAEGQHTLESSGKFSALFYPQTVNFSPAYKIHAISSYMLPGLTPDLEAADSIQFYYSANQHPKKQWANGPVHLCLNEKLTLYPNIARYTTWQWDFGDGSDTIQKVNENRAFPLNHTYDNPGQYWIKVADSVGCFKSDSLLVIVGLGPIAAFSATTNTGCSGTIVQLHNQSTGATDYLWQWPGGSSTAFEPAFNYTGQDSTIEITLIAKNELCADTLTQTFNIAPSTFNPEEIPNVFTPNADGVNDAFCIPNTTGFVDCFQLQIFNRWGRLVFESNEPQNCWQGESAADGVYFYALKIGAQQFTGAVTVMR